MPLDTSDFDQLQQLSIEWLFHLDVVLNWRCPSFTVHRCSISAQSYNTIIAGNFKNLDFRQSLKSPKGCQKQFKRLPKQFASKK